MKTIWKFAIPAGGGMVKMPAGAEIISLQAQRGDPVMWAIVDPEAEPSLRQFFVYGTGHELPDDPGDFRGTFQIMGGDLVFHVFEQGL